MTTKTLILMVGLPYSGKTTWALLSGHPIVSPDAIRLAIHGERYLGPAEPMVWTIAAYMVKALFEAGHDTVVVDAVNNTKERRQAWVGGGNWLIDYQVMHADEGTCLLRAKLSEDDVIVPVIKRMAAAHEPVTEPERIEARF